MWTLLLQTRTVRWSVLPNVLRACYERRSYQQDLAIELKYSQSQTNSCLVIGRLVPTISWKADQLWKLARARDSEIALKSTVQDGTMRLVPDYSKDFETLEKMEWAFSKGDVHFFKLVLDSRPSLLLRIHAVCMLADMKDEGAVPALCETLKEDPSPLVRHEAAFSLGQLEFKSAVPALLEAMANDESVLVRHESAVALGSIGDETARLGLIDRLRDPDEDVRLSAEVALADLDFLNRLRARTSRPLNAEYHL